MSYQISKIMDRGTANPIVARIGVGLDPFIQNAKIAEDKKKAIGQCCFEIMQSLIQAEKAAKPLIEEIKSIEGQILTNGIKTQSNGHAIETPGVLLLDNTRIFLKFAKQALQKLAKAMGILLEKEFNGPHFQKILQRAKEHLGISHPVTKLLEEDQEWSI